MTAEQFESILSTRLRLTRETLAAKAGEYASADRLHNFKADPVGCPETPPEVLWGYLRKHLTSLYDMATGVRPATPAAVTEKVGDSVCYLILLEAVLLEQHLPQNSPRPTQPDSPASSS